jgi:hypothetical protein
MNHQLPAEITRERARTAILALGLTGMSRIREVRIAIDKVTVKRFVVDEAGEPQIVDGAVVFQDITIPLVGK